jgi:hypothetical protein
MTNHLVVLGSLLALSATSATADSCATNSHDDGASRFQCGVIAERGEGGGGPIRPWPGGTGGGPIRPWPGGPGGPGHGGPGGGGFPVPPPPNGGGGHGGGGPGHGGPGGGGFPVPPPPNGGGGFPVPPPPNGGGGFPMPPPPPRDDFTFFVRDMERKSDLVMEYFRARQPEYGCPMLGNIMRDTYRFMTERPLNRDQNRYLRDVYSRMYENYDYYRCEMYR